MRVPSPEPPDADPESFALQGMLTIKLRSVLELTDEVLLRIGRDNEHLRFEVNAKGDLVIMSGVGTRGSYRNAAITSPLFAWALKDGTGAAFDSSGIFRLPSNALRAPDAAWVRLERLEVADSAAQDKAFLAICPDFVVELRSQSDRLSPLEAKMREYMTAGAQLGWLIDPIAKTPNIQVYRPAEPVVTLERPTTLSGDPILPGFVLDLEPVWRPPWRK